MIEATELRKQVRVVLSTRGDDESLSEPFINTALNRFFPESVRAADMMLALRWNEARGWVTKRRNADEERDEWKLTNAGRVKEGL